MLVFYQYLSVSGAINCAFRARKFVDEVSSPRILRPVCGVMAYVLSRGSAADGNASPPRAFLLPTENAAEAAPVSGTKVLPEHVKVCGHLSAPDSKLAPALRSGLRPSSHVDDWTVRHRKIDARTTVSGVDAGQERWRHAFRHRGDRPDHGLPRRTALKGVAVPFTRPHDLW